MEKNFIDIINKIKSFTNQYVVDTFKFERLNKNLLCIYLYGAHSSLLLFDGLKGLDAIGEIRYSHRGDKIFISQFECNPEFQGNGIGKFMFEMAMAHADAIGATSVYGYINPTNEIKGVEGGLEHEKAVLVNIYKKLGCNINDCKMHNNIVMDLMFEQKWNHGEKYSALSTQQKQFLVNVVSLENKLLKR